MSRHDWSDQADERYSRVVEHRSGNDTTGCSSGIAAGHVLRVRGSEPGRHEPGRRRARCRPRPLVAGHLPGVSRRRNGRLTDHRSVRLAGKAHRRVRDDQHPAGLRLPRHQGADSSGVPDDGVLVRREQLLRSHLGQKYCRPTGRAQRSRSGPGDPGRGDGTADLHRDLRLHVDHPVPATNGLRHGLRSGGTGHRCVSKRDDRLEHRR